MVFLQDFTEMAKMLKGQQLLQGQSQSPLPSPPFLHSLYSTSAQQASCCSSHPHPGLKVSTCSSPCLLQMAPSLTIFILVCVQKSPALTTPFLCKTAFQCPSHVIRFPALLSFRALIAYISAYCLLSPLEDSQRRDSVNFVYCYNLRT